MPPGSTILMLFKTESIISVNILKTSIILPLKRLYFKIGNFNCTSLSFHVKCLTVKTNLVALIGTFSRSFIRPCLCGFHNELAYSKWDLTKLLNSVTNASSVKYIKFLLIKPSMEYALFTFSLQWETKLNTESNTTPRSFITSTLSRAVDER